MLASTLADNHLLGFQPLCPSVKIVQNVLRQALKKESGGASGSLAQMRVAHWGSQDNPFVSLPFKPGTDSAKPRSQAPPPMDVSPLTQTKKTFGAWKGNERQIGFLCVCFFLVRIFFDKLHLANLLTPLVWLSVFS